MVHARDPAAIYGRHWSQRRRADRPVRIHGLGLRRHAQERVRQRRDGEPAAIRRVGGPVRHGAVQDRATARFDRQACRRGVAGSDCARVPNGTPSLCRDDKSRRATHRNLGHGQDRRERRPWGARAFPQRSDRIGERSGRVPAGPHRCRSGRKTFRGNACRRGRNDQRAHRARGSPAVGFGVVCTQRAAEGLHRDERQACAGLRSRDALDGPDRDTVVRNIGSCQHAQCAAGFLPICQAPELGFQPGLDRSRLSEVHVDRLRPRLYAATVRVRLPKGSKRKALAVVAVRLPSRRRASPAGDAREHASTSELTRSDRAFLPPNPAWHRKT